MDPHQVFHIRATGRGGVTIIDEDLKKCIIEENKKDKWLLETLTKVKTLGPHSTKKRLQEWNDEEGLVLHREKIYVSQNEQLHQDIVKMNHDNLAAGHLGQRGTLAIVGQEFTWPGISNTVHQYIEECVTCQSTKNNTHPTMVPLQPIEILDRLFGTITMDFITDLPKPNRYDLLHMVTNRFTKTAVITLCLKSINLDGTAKILLENTWR